MNILREVVGGLLKMFVGDAWLTLGVLSVVSLTGLLTGSGAVPPLLGAPSCFSVVSSCWWRASRPTVGDIAIAEVNTGIVDLIVPDTKDAPDDRTPARCRCLAGDSTRGRTPARVAGYVIRDEIRFICNGRPVPCNSLATMAAHIGGASSSQLRSAKRLFNRRRREPTTCA